MRTFLVSGVRSLRQLAGLCVLLVLVFSGCTTETTIDNSSQPAPLAQPSATPVEPTVAVAPTATVAAPEPTTAAAPTNTPTAAPAPTAQPTAIPQPTQAAVADTDHSGLAGSRGLTVQWISWEPEDWGTIEFVPLIDGSYAVSGTQQGPAGDFVSVDGTVVPVNERELWFTGSVVVQISHNNNGQPCERTGELTFLATGDRRFWRLQDLLNCDGIVTDYVDIYFG